MAGTPTKPEAGRVSLALIVALCATMSSSGAVTYTVATFGPELTDEFGLGRASLGLVPSVMYGAAVLASRPLGRLVDRVGAGTVSVIMLVTTPIGVAFIALANSYLMLLVGGVAGGLLMAASNPATNSLLAARIPPGSQGAAMGIKQSGATMMSLYIGGVGPPLAAALGWRGAALAMVAIVPLTALVFSRVPTAPATLGPLTDVAPTTKRSARPWIRWLSVYSVLLGVATANSNTYFVLYAKDQLDFSSLHAGWLVALMGAAGIVGRIVWASAWERLRTGAPILAWIAGIGGAATVLMLLAPLLGPSAMWIGVAVSGFSVQGWNSVGMLTVVHLTAFDAIGETSGVVLLPFFVGLAAGPTLFGAVVDWAGDFTLAWAGQAAALVVALLVAAVLYRSIDRVSAGLR